MRQRPGDDGLGRDDRLAVGSVGDAVRRARHEVHPICHDSIQRPVRARTGRASSMFGYIYIYMHYTRPYIVVTVPATVVGIIAFCVWCEHT